MVGIGCGGRERGREETYRPLGSLIPHKPVFVKPDILNVKSICILPSCIYVYIKAVLKLLDRIYL